MFDFRSLGGALPQRGSAGRLRWRQRSVRIILDTADALERPHGSHTFNYAGRKQDFTVPAGVTRLTIAASGASGGPGGIGGGRFGNAGGGGASFRGAAPGNGQIAVTW
jgi:hypothetical protein